MYYTIYKTINLINGKFYIGKHQTKNINDSYLGSGRAIMNAIGKYGKANFRKEILFVFDNEIEMNKKEQELVTEELISSDMNYNGAIGGEGGAHFKGRKHSEETKLKLRDKAILQMRNSPIIWTPEKRKRLSEAMKGNTNFKNYNRQPKSQETKDKIRRSVINYYTKLKQEDPVIQSGS